MRILVIGSGGREHALVWKLSQEATVFAAPGNPGIAECCECLQVDPVDAVSIKAAARACDADWVLIGPEDPLVAGVADALRNDGIATLGPGANGARLEASKAYSKALMARAGVPTARFGAFTEAGDARYFARSLADAGSKVVVKASGNALGKGVTVCDSILEADNAIEALLVDRQFGDAGAELVIEERLLGFEFSLLTLCNGVEFQSLPVAQDHKRALEGNCGPNTGGMGTVSPVAGVGRSLVEETETRVVAPILEALREDGIDYRGILFSGLMVSEGTPYCLEYNVRFGDPETQSIVRRIGSGFAQALHDVALGRPPHAIEVLDNAAVTVVAASGGYPGEYRKGLPISIDLLPAGVVAFHAGTATAEGRLVSNGGRVLALSACAATVEEARALAYDGIGRVSFEGMHYRRDIAAS